MRVVTVGVFDGVHKGHIKILEEVKKLSEKYDSKVEIYTIIYPMEYYVGSFPGLLITLEERLMHLEMYGAVYTLDLMNIKDVTADEFFKEISRNTAAIVVGEDFRFGKNARGDINYLKKQCEKSGIELKVVNNLLANGERISSTLIRNLILEGQIRKANELLGRPYSMHGKVYKDKQIGRKLGFPTANIKRDKALITPKPGVYLCRVYIPERYYGLMNIGYRPTVEQTEDIKYEVYILDFQGNLYGREIHIELLQFLRSEENFENINELTSQIRKDVKKARKIIAFLEERNEN
ncbi:bifunctional riboflavin kinase/FAD synthetase [Thermosipho ferrireducens]|uniref:Riboflavin biosynthesis protein n=1 Tax=Thermosipho ferrireducens TaxID=2571116 RepID=A0ABX7S7U1_9BACT|nr:bifunctional riboflavin kinase/FAD synthetase [Thermosipho ferrireducens]QTA38651.1 bifunctional riboflavin kinase/FAD synthetase [Thermosipho ferrireducens]